MFWIGAQLLEQIEHDVLALPRPIGIEEAQAAVIELEAARIGVKKFRGELASIR